MDAPREVRATHADLPAEASGRASPIRLAGRQDGGPTSERWVVFAWMIFIFYAPFPADLSAKKEISAQTRENIWKHTPILRDPLYNLGRAADHLEAWADGLLPPTPLLDVSALPG